MTSQVFKQHKTQINPNSYPYQSCPRVDSDKIVEHFISSHFKTLEAPEVS